MGGELAFRQRGAQLDLTQIDTDLEPIRSARGVTMSANLAG